MIGARKILSAFLAVCCAVSFSAVPVSAEEPVRAEQPEIYREDPNDNAVTETQAETSGYYEYTINDDGVSCTITKYIGNGGDVVIPGTLDGYSVTSIGSVAFYNCTSLTSIKIPDGITSISDATFYGCTSLASITIPDGVTSIGNWVFYNCSSLTSIKIPDGVSSIDDGTFYGCTFLASIKIPNGVTSIGSVAFYNCTSLTSIKIPDGITSISDGTFYGCTSLASITIPDSITSIGDYAFYECSNLTIYCNPGSYAETYAKENNITYKYIGTETPASPKITKAVAGDGQVALNWTSVDGAEKYSIYTYLNGKFTCIGSRTTTGMYVTGLTNGTKYGFLVRAYVNGAWTTYTSDDIVYATPVGAAKPKITKAVAGNGQVALNWTAVDGAEKYSVYTYLNGKFTCIGSRTTTGMYVTGLTNGTKYGFLVRAYVNGAWTSYTSDDIVYATPVGAAKPQITKAVAGDGQVALNWTAVDGATKYSIYTYLNGKYTCVGSRTATGMYVTGLTNGTKYGFLVRAYVNGAWTSYTSADIVYATPTATKASLINIFTDDIEFIDTISVIA